MLWVISTVEPSGAGEVEAPRMVRVLVSLSNVPVKLIGLLFIESNPIPVKWAVSQMGYGELNLRLPMTRLSEQYHQSLKQTMIDSGAL